MHTKVWTCLETPKKYSEAPKIHQQYSSSLTDLPKIQHGSFTRNGGSEEKAVKTNEIIKFSFATALHELRYCKLMTKRNLHWTPEKFIFVVLRYQRWVQNTRTGNTGQIHHQKIKHQDLASRPSQPINKIIDSFCLHNKSDQTTSAGHGLQANLTDFQYFKLKS